MPKKLSGAENRKRKAQQDRAVQEIMKLMSLEKYIKIDNKKIDIDAPPSTQPSIIDSQNIESSESVGNSQNKSVFSNSLENVRDSEINSENVTLKPQNSSNVLKNLELITSSKANDFQTANNSGIPLSSLSTSEENGNLAKQEESEIVITKKLENSLIDLTDPALQHILNIDSTDPANWPKK